MPIKDFLGDPKSGTDGWFERRIERVVSESFVYMVHSRDDHGKAGSRTQEKEGCILEYLGGYQANNRTREHW
jgi:hypothetical protein